MGDVCARLQHPPHHDQVGRGVYLRHVRYGLYTSALAGGEWGLAHLCGGCWTGKRMMIMVMVIVFSGTNRTGEKMLILMVVTRFM